MNGKERVKRGEIGWAAIGAFVVGWDLLAPESLTSAFRRGVENPRTRAAVLGAWAVTTAHLLDVIPHQVDPFYVALDHVGALNRRSDVLQ